MELPEYEVIRRDLEREAGGKKIAEADAKRIAAEADAKKFFEKGNKTAGTRLRKTMQDIKAAASAVRTEVQGAKKGEAEVEKS
mgnify:CR=1 FL=1